ncbi:MAG: hypothetical protein ACFCVD_23855 [Nodosilinea sp.]
MRQFPQQLGSVPIMPVGLIYGLFPVERLVGSAHPAVHRAFGIQNPLRQCHSTQEQHFPPPLRPSG